MIGALVFGPLADRIGRKKIIIFSTLTFGLGALVTAFVSGRQHACFAIRFLTGLGLGRSDAERHRADVRIQSTAPPAPPW